jgi:hypothetical protein
MIEKLLGAVAEPWAHRWADGIGGAVVFWAVGALLLLMTDPSTVNCDSGRPLPWCQLPGDPSGPAVILLAVGLVGAAVLISARMVAATAPQLVHLLAGVGWPRHGLLAGVTQWRTSRHAVRRQRLATDLTSEPIRATRLRTKLRRYPGAVPVAPTRIGNAFAATMQRVDDRHGLRLAVCWEAFVSALPDHERSRLDKQAAITLGRAQSLVWATAAVGWVGLLRSPWWIVAWLAGTAAAAAVAYTGLCHSVEAYCDLIEGQVATGRHALYRRIGFPLPVSTADEPAAGARLSDYLEAESAISVPLAWSDSAA